MHAACCCPHLLRVARYFVPASGFLLAVAARSPAAGCRSPDTRTAISLPPSTAPGPAEDRGADPRCARATVRDATRGSPRGCPIAEPRAHGRRHTPPAACSADSRAVPTRTNPAPPIPHRSAHPASAARSHRSASAPAARLRKRRNRRSPPPRRLRARAAARRFPRTALPAAPAPCPRPLRRARPPARARGGFRQGTGGACASHGNPLPSAPRAPPRAPSPAAPPSSPSPARHRTAGHRRSGIGPARNRAGSTRRGATALARARGP